ncbi:MAG: hypothetical protein P8074_26370 [Anaerolineales bacterium]
MRKDHGPDQSTPAKVPAIANPGILSQLIAAWDEHGSTRNFYPFREYLLPGRTR